LAKGPFSFAGERKGIFGQWIHRKSLKWLPPDAIILRLKCSKFDFGWDSAPDPAGFRGAYTSKVREGSSVG